MIKMTQPYQKARGPLCCMKNHVNEVINEQECIPVGCIPSAAVAVSWGGGCLPGGWYLPRREGVLPRRVGVCWGGGVCRGGDVCRGGGVCQGVSA